MSVSKRWIMIGVSLTLAGLMTVLVVGLMAAAGGPWRSVGFNGGSVMQLVAADTNPTTFYARTGTSVFFPTASASGIWRSTDGGASWQSTAVAVDTTSGYDNLMLSAMGVSGDGNTVCASVGGGMIMLGPDTHIWCSTD